MATQFTHRATRDGTGLVLCGDIDLTVREQLLGALLVMLVRAGPVAAVNLRGVTFLDCSGIGALVAANNAARREGQNLNVIRPQRLVRDVLEITGVLPTLVCPLVGPARPEPERHDRRTAPQTQLAASAGI
jgi:anti-anti-sigma factor